jgi:hypothetical protein
LEDEMTNLKVAFIMFRARIISYLAKVKRHKAEKEILRDAKKAGLL